MAMSVTYATVNGQLVYEDRGGTETYYLNDPLGSVVQCHDATGAKTYEAWYWPYGEVRVATGSNPSPWGFVGSLGYYTDDNSHIYVRARIYRPDLARWQTVDPIWPWLSAYIYVHLAPTSLADPTGMFTPTTHHRGSCAVFSCFKYDLKHPILTPFLPAHVAICVNGPHGGCSGGLYPLGDDDFRGPGRVEPVFFNCREGVIVDVSTNSTDIWNCTVQSVNCADARSVCACLKARSSNPPWYNLLTSNCVDFADEILSDCTRHLSPIPLPPCNGKKCPGGAVLNVETCSCIWE